MSEIKTHTRNQKRMYRIHKLEEKIHNQDLLIGNLQQENQGLKRANATLELAFDLAKSKEEQYKSVLNEIRRYLINNRNTCYMNDDIDNLLQIIYMVRE